jgi:hypothetical protein
MFTNGKAIVVVAFLHVRHERPNFYSFFITLTPNHHSSNLLFGIFKSSSIAARPNSLGQEDLTMQARHWMISLFGIVLLMTAGFAAFSAQAQDSGALPDATLYTGQIVGIPDEFVGVSIIGTDATVYICDGQPDKGTVSIAEWFIGPVTDKTIDVTNPSGNRVQVTLTDTLADGSFTFADGSVKTFSIGLSFDNSALYRSEFTFGEVSFVGGWLILPNGQVRGAVFNKSTSTLSPATFSGFNLISDGEPANVG